VFEWDLFCDILLEDVKVKRKRLAHPDGAFSMVEKYLLGQRMNKDRVLVAVEGKPREQSCKTLNGAPHLKAAKDVRATGARVDSAVHGLWDDGDIALFNEFAYFIAYGDGRLATLGVALEVVQVEVIFFDLVGECGSERVHRLGQQGQVHGRGG